MESVESLDKVHVYSEQSPGSPLNWTMSMHSLDNVHGLSGKSGQCPWISWTKAREPTQTGQCPWTMSTEFMKLSLSPWTMPMDSVDYFHGLSRHCPWTLSSPLIPILQLDNIHGKCPLSPWTFYRRGDTIAFLLENC